MNTVLSVLGFVTDEKKFNCVITLNKYFFFASLVTTLMIALLGLAENFTNILLSSWALNTLVSGISLRLRLKKSTKTRMTANKSFFLSWLLFSFVTYAHFGIASFGTSRYYDYLLGYPVSKIDHHFGESSA